VLVACCKDVVGNTSLPHQSGNTCLDGLQSGTVWRLANGRDLPNGPYLLNRHYACLDPPSLLYALRIFDSRIYLVVAAERIGTLACVLK